MWLTPHMNTLSRGSLARNNFTFWCLTRKCFFFSLLSPLENCGTLDMVLMFSLNFGCLWLWESVEAGTCVQPFIRIVSSYSSSVVEAFKLCAEHVSSSPMSQVQRGYSSDANKLDCYANSSRIGRMTWARARARRVASDWWVMTDELLSSELGAGDSSTSRRTQGEPRFGTVDEQLSSLKMVGHGLAQLPTLHLSANHPN